MVKNSAEHILNHAHDRFLGPGIRAGAFTNYWLLELLLTFTVVELLLLALPLLALPPVVLPLLLTEPLVAVWELLFETEIEVLFVLVTVQVVEEVTLFFEPGPVLVIEILVLLPGGQLGVPVAVMGAVVMVVSVSFADEARLARVPDTPKATAGSTSTIAAAQTSGFGRRRDDDDDGGRRAAMRCSACSSASSRA